jgi:hypothetical protein
MSGNITPETGHNPGYLGVLERIGNHLPRVRDHRGFVGLGAGVVLMASLASLGGTHENEGTHTKISLVSFENVADLRTAFMTADEDTTSEATFHQKGPDPWVAYSGHGKIEAETFVPWKAATKIFEGKQPGTQIIQVDLSKVETNLYFRDSSWSTKVHYNRVLGGISVLGGGNSIIDSINGMNDAVERDLEQKTLNGFGEECGPKLETPIEKTIRKTVKVIAGDQDINPKDVRVQLVGGPIEWMTVNNLQLNKKVVTVGNPKLDTLDCDTSKMKIIDKTGEGAE